MSTDAVVIRLTGLEEAATTAALTATNVSSSTIVRVVNKATATVYITMIDQANAVISTITLSPNEALFLAKRATDKLYASATTVGFAPIADPRS